MSVVLFLLAAAATPANAPAQPPAAFNKPVPPGKVSTANPRSIVAALQKAGYRAKLVTDDGARPYVESATDGATFYIYLESCTEDRDCQDVMFRSSYDKSTDKPIKLDAINGFNRKSRWARAYLEEDGDAVIEYDVLFTGQLADDKMFQDALEIWEDVLSNFHDAIGW